MPKREDINSILIIGSGPIVIGQACEFDYSGTQACKALREEGYKVSLVNSNPATIMTDPEFADRTYIEPITPEMVERIIEKERPDALLPTLGGQTALNTAVALADNGVLEKYNVELIGARLESIHKAEDRKLFFEAMERIGLEQPRSEVVETVEAAWAFQKKIGSFPIIIRPSFTMGGTGGSIAYNADEYEGLVQRALNDSPTSSTLLDESLLGWKEFELEVMRDTADNVVIICSIENFDPMGVHTGDSITVAPIQTLTDKEYQVMRDASLKIIREIGVDTGGCNIQFGVNPANGRMVVIEMNPRVSRSSALASKATGFPIAKIAAKLAVGYTLDEIQNDITETTPASFEPAIDYVVTKVPRFTFEKFAGSDRSLSTQMQSVGEVMAIGRSFQESMGKALRGLEMGTYGLEASAINKVAGGDAVDESAPGANMDVLRKLMRKPGPERTWVVAEAIRQGMSKEEVFELTGIDPWFVQNLFAIIEMEKTIADAKELDAHLLRRAKRSGLSDKRIAELRGVDEAAVRAQRKEQGVVAVMKRVDTCAGEFEAHTPYLYSSYEEECEAHPTDQKKVIILGGGPNRIGQGIEFDYCCVHAVMGLKKDGLETIMVNCNPETVSTDYDTSDRLYFEPLTLEDVLRIIDIEKPYGVIVQFGGQTPLKLAHGLEQAGVKILGTSPDAIDLAEDRERFAALVTKLGLKQPANGLARSEDEAAKIATDVGYPVLLRPSYVLGGRAMEVCGNEPALREYMKRALAATPDIETRPVLVDQYLQEAIELDVDAVSDGNHVVVGGVLEHIERAGVHSGDSAMAMPPHSVSEAVLERVYEQTKAIAKEIGVVGLMNVQYAVRNEEVYIIEVNPRASRTIPFISKVTGVPLAQVAARVMAGQTLAALGVTEKPAERFVAVKESVFPFAKFQNADTILGPEMKSTGEVMGVDTQFDRAFAKASIGAGTKLPSEGKVFVSVADSDKSRIGDVAKRLASMGYALVATSGTAKHLEEQGLNVEMVKKVREGSPNVVEAIDAGEIAIVMNTTLGEEAIRDSFSIRRQALLGGVPYFTTAAAASAVADALEALREAPLGVAALQDFE